MGSTSLLCDLLTKDLLYPLSVKYRAGKDQDPVKMLKIQLLIDPFHIVISLCNRSSIEKSIKSFLKMKGQIAY